MQSWHPTLVYSPATRSPVFSEVSWGHGECEQVDEIESDSPPPSSTRYGVQATISIVFSDFIQRSSLGGSLLGGSG